MPIKIEAMYGVGSSCDHYNTNINRGQSVCSNRIYLHIQQLTIAATHILSAARIWPAQSQSSRSDFPSSPAAVSLHLRLSTPDLYHFLHTISIHGLFPLVTSFANLDLMLHRVIHDNEDIMSVQAGAVSFFRDRKDLMEAILTAKMPMDE